MGKFYKGIMLFFCLFQMQLVFGQTVDLRFLGFEHNQELSSVYVSSIEQDALGFMWFGTTNGLHKFDGYTITKYLSDDGLNFNISDFNIRHLYYDSKERLWISMNTGLYYYNYQKDSILLVSNEQYPHGLKEYNVVTILESADSVLYVSSGNSIFRLNENTLSFEEVFRLTDASIASFCFDNMGNIWIGTINGKGLFRYQLATKEYDFIEVPYLNNGNVNISRVLFYLDKIWIASLGEGIISYLPDEGQFQKYIIDDEYAKNVMDLYVDKEQFLWAVDMTGLKLYVKDHDLFQGYYTDKSNTYSIKANVYSIFQDRSLNYWTIHYPGGIDYSPRPKGFVRFGTQMNSPFSLNVAPITAIIEDELGNLYMSNPYNGITIFDWQKGKTIEYNYDPANPNCLGKGATQDLFFDSKSNIWVGSYWGGLQMFRHDAKEFLSYTHDPDNPFSISSNDVRAITEDKNGIIWLCSHGKGVDRFNPATGKFRNYNTQKNDLSNDYTFDITVDEENAIWVSTAWGASRLVFGDSVFQNYLHENSSESSISSNVTNTVFIDRMNRVWIGTSNGLNLYNRENNSFDVFTNGFLSKNILSIIDDEDNNIWVGTSNGISRLNPQTQEVLNLSKDDGLISNDMVPRSVFNNGKNSLFFGSLDGLTYFNPKNLKMNSEPPKIYITGFKIFNKEITVHNSRLLSENIITAKEIKLNYTDNIIEITYSGLSYSGSDNNQYAYYLEGFEDAWNYVGSKRTVSYTNLKPGKYTFRVKATNNEGLWNENDVSLSLIITPPFWENWWFQGLIGLFIVSFVLLYIRQREKNLRKKKIYLENTVKERTIEINQKNILLESQKDELEKVNDLKNRFFNILAHDLRGPVFSMVQLTELLKKNQLQGGKLSESKVLDLFETASQNTYKLLEDLLLWGKAQSNRIELNVETFDLVSLVNESMSNLFSIAANKSIVITIQLNDPILVVADSNTVKVVVRNLISNAIKFSFPDSEILVDINKDDSEAILMVRDFGVGMAEKTKDELFSSLVKTSVVGTKGEKGSGLGMSLSKELVMQNKGRIWVESELGKGSTFYVSLPLAK